MDTIDNINGLLEVPGGWAVSIYMPAHPTGRETQQDPIRLKNLLSNVAKDLEFLGMRSPDVNQLLKPARDLLTNTVFWQNQSQGLALFCSSDQFYSYRLPVSFEEQAVVLKRFMIKPLIPLFNRDSRYYILGLSQNQVRLYQGTQFDIQEIDIGNVPASLAEALRFDEPEKQLQFQTGTRSPHGGGRRPANFHGHGVGNDNAKSDLLRFFQQIDRALGDYLNNHQAPLILAGVDYLLPIYRKANTYPELIGPGIEGNPEELRPAELQGRAWPLVAARFKNDEQTLLERYSQIESRTRELTSHDLAPILSAAYQGQIETLFIASDLQCWGKFDSQRQGIEKYERYEPGSEELVDSAAAHTLINSGKVYVLPKRDVPAGGPAAAILRYA